MPLKWKRGTNPYVDNAFGVLQVGAMSPAARVAALAGQQRSRVRARGAAEADTGAAALHAIGDAEACLNTPARRAEEQLLAHPPAQGDGARRQRLGQELRKAARLVDAGEPLALRAPRAIFWFLPLPGQDAVEAPPWDSLGLCAAGDPDDRALDIVFDD
ncbi:MAG: hypothetical protein AB7F93_09815 [Immundisolibacter sp.]|uniref:hypothetical protein n=1 Tax=Immundisolibacter sp. TaxID=1934948 RepID=UPI003D134FBD